MMKDVGDVRLAAKDGQGLDTGIAGIPILMSYHIQLSIYIIMKTNEDICLHIV